MKLHCQSFELGASIDGLPTVTAKFLVPVSPHIIEELADAFRQITMYMGESIELVKAQSGKWRCFYCVCLNDDKENHCTQCGGTK